MIVAIHPDKEGIDNSSSPIWNRCLREAGIGVREVDVFGADILEQVKGCKGFMWRHGHYPWVRQVARRLLPVFEDLLGMVVYPDQKTCWHYDDKVAQRYLLEAAGIPIPQTWVWFDRQQALRWAADAAYPLVLKLWAGAGSSNVRLIQSVAEAQWWIERLFNAGVASLDTTAFSLRGRIRVAVNAFAKGGCAGFWEPHKGYVLVQEFLPGNDFDTRVTVVGNRAFAYRRFNRPGDFRASGSGNFDPDPARIDLDAVRLAFATAARLGTQSVAIDGLRRKDQWVVGEISYTYVSWMVRACPGHWDANLQWHPGPMWPEEAQAADFISKLRSRGNR